MYKLLNSFSEQTFVLKLDVNTSIPFDPANTDYQQYLAWLAEGNVPEEPQE